MNYSNGRFRVVDAQNKDIGRIDCDEFIRNSRALPIYRLDGDEVYDMKGNLMGFIDSGVLISGGDILLRISPE